jgi:anti-sigma factor RsiW
MKSRVQSCPLQQPESAGLLIDFVAGRLPLDRASVLSAHAAGCETCQEFIAAQGEVWAALEEWQPEPVSASFDRRLNARIEAEGRVSQWQRWFAPAVLWKPAAAMSLAVGVWVAVGTVRSPETLPVVPAVEQKALVEAPDLDQVEQTLEDLDLLNTVL